MDDDANDKRDKQMWIEISAKAIVGEVGEKIYHPYLKPHEAVGSVYRVSEKEAEEYSLLKSDMISLCDVCRSYVNQIPVQYQDPIKENWFHTACYCPKCKVRTDLSYYYNSDRW